MQNIPFYYGTTTQESPLNKPHLQRVTHWSSVPLHFHSWPQSLYSSLWISLLSISENPIIAYESTLFCKLCYPCHFWCCAFVQRMLLPMLVSMLTLSMRPTYLETSVSLLFTLCIINSFWFSARVGCCGMHQCPPSNGLAPSTLAHYLGLRLETYIVPWSLQSFVEGFSSLSIVGSHYCSLILQAAWLQQIYSSLLRMYS